MIGQLPIERVTPDLVFEDVGVDYAGPVVIKHGYVRKPTLVKAYICIIFVSLMVKAAHIELVSDLTTDAFLSTLRRFIARRGKPKKRISGESENSSVCLKGLITPEKSPTFGCLWELCVKSTEKQS